MTRRLLVLFVLFGAVLWCQGQLLPTQRASAQASPTRTYVGTVAGSDALIAIVTNGYQVEAYVCDGTPQGVALWGRFFGAASEQQAALVSSNGLGLLLDLSGATPGRQVVTKDGGQLVFATEQATGSGGLWEAQGLVNGLPVCAGWVLLNDGQQRGTAIKAGSAIPAPGFTTPIGGLGVQPVMVARGVLQAKPVNGFVTPIGGL